MTVVVVPRWSYLPPWVTVALFAASSFSGQPWAAGAEAPLAARRPLALVRSLVIGTRHSPPHSPRGSALTLTLLVPPPRDAQTRCEARPAGHRYDRRVCHDPVTRRSALETVASGVSIAAVWTTAAAGVGASTQGVTGDEAGVAAKPHAPLEALLPATRVRVLIDEAVDAAGALAKLRGDEERRGEDEGRRTAALVAELRGLLLESRQFIEDRGRQQLPPQRTSGGTWGDWSRARRGEARETLEALQTDDDATSSFVPALAVRANEAFEQWGERRQWDRLRRRQRSLEADDPIRAAFNAYTDRLVFGESYALNASGEERSRLLRTYDQLPDVTSVIRSDLDLRDLYRNQILTAVDDARAELVYQTEKSEGGLDATDLLAILREAQSSCLEWFKFVPADDVKDALDAVKKEQE